MNILDLSTKDYFKSSVIYRLAPHQKLHSLIKETNKTTINITADILKELNSKLELKTSVWRNAKHLRGKLKDKEEKMGY